MKLFNAILILLMVLISACAQQAQQQQQQQPQQQVQQQPEAQPQQDEQPAEIVQEVKEPEQSTASSNEVRILGKGGLEPLELKITAGSAVTWFNDDKKDIQFTVFKDGKFYLNSAIMKPGEKFEHEFKEKGDYEYWTLAYGPQGAKITVE